MWDNLSIKEKADVIKVAIRNGVVGLPEIRESYNSFAGGGYTEWLEKLSHKKSKEWGIPQKELYNQMLNDETYSYETFYNNNREDAEKMLTADPDAHFNDSGKTYLHPTYSDESKVPNQPFKGGHWSEGPWGKNSNTYTLSKEQIDNRWDIGRTMDYLSEAEDNGVVMRMPNGTLVRDEKGDIFGGVLPAVEINKYAGGGPKEDEEEPTYMGVLPFKEMVVYPSQEQQRKAAVRRALSAQKPTTDFTRAADITMEEGRDMTSRAKGVIRGSWFTDLLNGFRRYPYNCINTATDWITNGNDTVARNQNLYNNPTKYGYTEVSYNEMQPGDLMQYVSDGEPWHAAVVTNKGERKTLKNNKLHTFSVRSSTGDDTLNPVRNYTLEEVGTEDTMLDSMPKFYRYKYPHSGVEFIKANGGNLYWEGGYKPSEEVKKRIAKWEGKAMTEGTIDPLSKKKVGKNRSFEAEAVSFVAALPKEIREEILSNQALADNLYSYSYNVGAGNFKNRVVPALMAYYSGKGNADGIANSMWASGDKKLRGLQRRRAVEKAGVLSALNGATLPSRVELGLEVPEFNNQPTFETPMLVENDPTVYKAPVIDDTLFAQPKTVVEEIYSPEKERYDSMQRMSNVFAMMGMESPFSGMEGSPLMMLGNMSAMGGNIFDGGGQKTIWKDEKGYYTLDDDSHRVDVSRYGEWGNEGDPSTWEFSDDSGKVYSPHGTNYGKPMPLMPEKGLQGVYPEFDLLTLAPLVGTATKYGIGKLIGTSVPVEQQSIRSSLAKFFTKDKTITEDEVKRALIEAAKYKNSEGYKALIDKARKESVDLGIGDFPEEAFYSGIKGNPIINLETRDPESLGGYTYETNTISLDPKQIRDSKAFETPYHEALHKERVGINSFEIGPLSKKWYNAWLNKSSDEETLYNKLMKSNERNRFQMRRNGDDYLNYKANQVLYPEASDYIRNNGEYIVHGLESGKALGIKPFTEYPGFEKAVKYIDKARKYDTFLYYIKAGNEENVRNFWDILTGNYHPAIVPTAVGIGTASTLFNNNNRQ